LFSKNNDVINKLKNYLSKKREGKNNANSGSNSNNNNGNNNNNIMSLDNKNSTKDITISNKLP